MFEQQSINFLFSFTTTKNPQFGLLTSSTRTLFERQFNCFFCLEKTKNTGFQKKHINLIKRHLNKIYKKKKTFSLSKIFRYFFLPNSTARQRKWRVEQFARWHFCLHIKARLFKLFSILIFFFDFRLFLTSFFRNSK